MTSCVICSITLKRRQSDSVSRVTCNRFFHLKYIPLKEEDTDYLKYIKKTGSCKDCLSKHIGNSASSQSVLPPSPSTKSSGQSKLIELVNKQNQKLDTFE